MSTRALNAEREKRRLAEVREAALNDFFDDMYHNRRRIYRVNFFRGVYFGLGSALGGTVVIALVVWVLGWFVNWPLVEQIIRTLQPR